MKYNFRQIHEISIITYKNETWLFQKKNSIKFLSQGINNNNKNNKPKASPLRGTSDIEHTPFYLHTHPLKQDSKQKAFNLQPLWASQNLSYLRKKTWLNGKFL